MSSGRNELFLVDRPDAGGWHKNNTFVINVLWSFALINWWWSKWIQHEDLSLVIVLFCYPHIFKYMISFYVLPGDQICFLIQAFPHPHLLLSLSWAVLLGVFDGFSGLRVWGKQGSGRNSHCLTLFLILKQNKNRPTLKIARCGTCNNRQHPQVCGVNHGLDIAWLLVYKLYEGRHIACYRRRCCTAIFNTFNCFAF